MLWQHMHCFNVQISKISELSQYEVNPPHCIFLNDGIIRIPFSAQKTLEKNLTWANFLNDFSQCTQKPIIWNNLLQPVDFLESGTCAFDLAHKSRMQEGVRKRKDEQRQTKMDRRTERNMRNDLEIKKFLEVCILIQMYKNFPCQFIRSIDKPASNNNFMEILSLLDVLLRNIAGAFLHLKSQNQIIISRFGNSNGINQEMSFFLPYPV